MAFDGDDTPLRQAKGINAVKYGQSVAIVPVDSESIMSGLAPLSEPVGTLSKRMRTRLRSRRSRNDRSIRVSTDPTEGGSQSLMKVAEWIPYLDGMRPAILPKSGADALDISGFTQEELRTSISRYEDFMEIPRGLATINQVVHSSAGIKGWLDHDPDHLMRVGQEVH